VLEEMVRDVFRARASAEVGAHERAEDLAVAVAIACCPQTKCRVCRF
jgi:hypothetical protein